MLLPSASVVTPAHNRLGAVEWGNVYFYKKGVYTSAPAHQLRLLPWMYRADMIMLLEEHILNTATKGEQQHIHRHMHTHTCTDSHLVGWLQVSM